MEERSFGPVRFLPGKNEGKFPFCHSIYIDGVGPGPVLSGFTIKGGGAASTVICGTATIEYNIFRNNILYFVSSFAVIEAYDRALIRYNLFYDNYGNATIRSMSNAEIINNTIVDNANGIYAGGSETIIRNNIITYNSGYGVIGNPGYFDYNDVWSNGYGNILDDNGISSDPLYVNAAGDDFNLWQASPCVDAGDPNPIYNDMNGTRNDMGALPFIFCGDTNLDNEVSISDIVLLINYYFAGGPPPKVLNRSDLSCDEVINLVDIILLNSFVLSNGSINCCD